MIIFMKGVNKNFKNIKYNQNCAKSNAFRKDLDQRVKNYFKESNQNKKESLWAWIRAIIIYAGYFTSWYQLIFVPQTTISIFFFILLGVVSIHTMATAIAHDAVHGCFSKYDWANKFVYWLSFTLMGGNYYVWSVRHNIPHHYYVNIPGCDVDIEGAKQLRVAPHCPWRPMHRFQHFYQPILYSIFTMHWIFIKDFKMFTMKEFGNVGNATYPWYRWLEMIVLKIFYVGYMIILPVMMGHGLADVLTVFVIFHLIFSYFITIAFSSSHVIKDSKFIMYDKEGQLPYSFYEHQLLTSFDFWPKSRFVSFFYGGFSSHVAHHFYPNINSVYYPAISEFIQEACKKHDMPYNEAPLWYLAAEHRRFLKLLGQNKNTGLESFVGAEHFKPEKPEQAASFFLEPEGSR